MFASSRPTGGAGSAAPSSCAQEDFPARSPARGNASFGHALGQAFTPDYPAWSVGVTVNYALGRSFEEAGAAKAEVERRQVEQRIASLRLDAAETVRRAGRQIRSAAERMDAARAGATLARERLDVEQRRYEVGLSTTFLVTQAQRDLLAGARSACCARRSTTNRRWCSSRPSSRRRRPARASRWG